MNSNGWRLASVKGTPITIHPTAAVLALLFAYSWAQTRSERGIGEAWLAGLAGVVCIFVIILVHELGHVGAARLFGVHTTEVSLYGLGGLSQLEEEPPTALAEVVISAAGPLVNLALASVGLLVAPVNHWFNPFFLTGIGFFDFLVVSFASMNLLLGIFNLLPGPPLDGGGIMRGLGWMVTRDQQRGRSVSAITGLICTAGLIYLAFTPFAQDNFLILLYAAAIMGLGAYSYLRQSQTPESSSASDDQIHLVLIDAQAIASQLGSHSVGSIHLLLALLNKPETPLVSLLAAHGVTYTAVEAVARSNHASIASSQPANPPGTPLVSMGARTILTDAQVSNLGGLGVFLALPEQSEAGTTLDRLGASLSNLQTLARNTFSP